MTSHPSFLRLVNQLFEATRKAAASDTHKPIQRHLERMTEALEEMGIRIHNPLGEPYNESRTDYEASIAGNGGKLFITEVLKPSIYGLEEGKATLLQKAVVIADNN